MNGGGGGDVVGGGGGGVAVAAVSLLEGGTIWGEEEEEGGIGEDEGKRWEERGGVARGAGESRAAVDGAGAGAVTKLDAISCTSTGPSDQPGGSRQGYPLSFPFLLDIFHFIHLPHPLRCGKPQAYRKSHQPIIIPVTLIPLTLLDLNLPSLILANFILVLQFMANRGSEGIASIRFDLLSEAQTMEVGLSVFEVTTSLCDAETEARC